MNEDLTVGSTLIQTIRDIETRFTSGNDVPVMDIRLTRDQWEIIKRHLFTENKKN